MMGVFVQVNDKSHKAISHPIGYVVQENGCWFWVGATTEHGYGRWDTKDGQAKAHRRMFEMAKGPIPRGLDLDHLCRNPPCVNPDHLEPVTHKVNMLRGINPPAMNKRKTHCPKGHPLSGDNLFAGAHRTGKRDCRTCSMERSRKYHERVRHGASS